MNMTLSLHQLMMPLVVELCLEVKKTTQYLRKKTIQHLRKKTTQQNLGVLSQVLFLLLMILLGVHLIQAPQKW